MLLPISRAGLLFVVLLLSLVSFGRPVLGQPEFPLPSWHEGEAKQAIIEFVQTVTDAENPAFVPPAERIAVFDHDGTLWAEQPLYFQLAFALDRVKSLAPMHPEWQEQQPFQAVLADDMDALLAGGPATTLELVFATHTGNTTTEFSQIVKDWLATATHPTTGRPFTAMVYQPMLELLAYLRANEFKPYIVSAGGVEFMRVFAEDVYDIPPEQVIGSSTKLQFEQRDGSPALFRLPQISFVNDRANKPVAIEQYIGRRPIAAFGNSDGDLQMLQWTATGPGLRLALLVHHTDAEREWAYDRESTIGRLDAALDEALSNGWIVVDMAQDWQVIF